MTPYERILRSEKEIKKLKKIICCIQGQSNFSELFNIINIGAGEPDPLQINTVQVNNAGEVFFVDSTGNIQQIEFIQETEIMCENCLYVDKRFTGVASATVTGTGITSTNAEYNTQLAAATVGSAERPYPCIWSAQLEAKALTAIDNKHYTIKILEGNIFTIGSPTLTQNGDRTGNAGVNEEADIKVANVTADLLAASLGANRITYEFGENTFIINICKSHTIRLIDLPITSVVWETKVVGKGSFHWLYGSVEGIGCNLLRSLDVVNLDLIFKGKKALINRFESVVIRGFQNVVIDFDQWWEYTSQFNVFGTDDWVTAGRRMPICIINIRDRRRGINLFSGLPAGDSTNTGGTNKFHHPFGAYYSITIDTWINNEFSSLNGTLLRWQGGGATQMTNNTVIFNVNRFVHTYIGGAATAFAGMFDMAVSSTPAVNTNNRIEFNFGHVTSMGSFCDTANIGILNNLSNSTLILNVTGVWENTSSVNPAIGIAFTASTNINNQVIVKGNFVSTGGGTLLSNNGTGALTPTNAIAFQFKNCEFVQKVAAKPAINFLSGKTNMNVFFDNVKVVNDGATEIISKNATNAPMQILCSNVWTNNTLISANLTIDGDAIKTNTRLGNTLLM